MSKLPKTPVGRVSFASVFQKRKNDQGEDKYEMTLIWDAGEDLSVLEDAIEEAIEEEWGSKRPKNIKTPLKDNSEEGKDYDGYADDCLFASFKDKRRPGIVDANLNEISEDEGNSEEFYSGCYAKVAFDCYAGTFGKVPRVCFGLKAIQKIDDGEPFSGGAVDAKDEFAEDDDEPPKRSRRRRRRAS